MALNEQKNRQILDAAIEEFLEHGFLGARMDRIADRAQVSKRTVYNHFDSKDALFDAMIETMMSGFRTAFDVRYEPGKPILEQLRTVARAEGALFTSKSFMKLVRLLMAEAYRDPDLARRLPREGSDDASLRGFFEDAAADGALSITDFRLAATQFKGLLKAQAFWPSLIGGRVLTSGQMEQVIEDAIAMFTACYGAKA